MQEGHLGWKSWTTQRRCSCSKPKVSQLLPRGLEMNQIAAPDFTTQVLASKRSAHCPVAGLTQVVHHVQHTATLAMSRGFRGCYALAESLVGAAAVGLHAVHLKAALRTSALSLSGRVRAFWAPGKPASSCDCIRGDREAKPWVPYMFRDASECALLDHPRLRQLPTRHSGS